jgi:hypothetical protein
VLRLCLQVICSFQLAKACAITKSDAGDFDDKNFWSR